MNPNSTIERLPAENDSILQRVEKIRERDYLYIDTMQDYYDVFSQQMHLPYQDFRRASYDSALCGHGNAYRWSGRTATRPRHHLKALSARLPTSS